MAVAPLYIPVAQEVLSDFHKVMTELELQLNPPQYNPVFLLPMQ